MKVEEIPKEIIKPEKPVEKKEEPKKVDQKFIDISTYNGDDTGKYKWS